MDIQDTRRATRRKILALAAGGAVLGIGVTATLAAWTDSEWVFGGNGAGGAGIGTSTFEVQQNTVDPSAAGSWVSEDANPGGEITFGLEALDLAPGDAVYADFALRAAPTSIAGTVELQPAVPAVPAAATDALLFETLNVRVATDAAPFDCDDDAFAAAPGGPQVIADGALDSTGGSDIQTLDAAAGSTQYYCFEVSLPDPITPGAGQTIESFMGLTAAPAWRFEAESGTPAITPIP